MIHIQSLKEKNNGTLLQKHKCEPRSVNWSDTDRLIHRTLSRMPIGDFLELAKLSNNYYFKMLASDLQHEGPPSVNLQRAYRELGDIQEIGRVLEKVDGLWTLRNGEWINIVSQEVKNAR